MPCRDLDDCPLCNDDSTAKNKEIQFLTASLCAILNAIRDNPTDMVGYYLQKADWEKAGVERKEFEAWWKKHKKRDIERHRKEVRMSALAKLTAEEKEVLGVK